MTRLREKDVYKICISKEESNKLLDYENNKSHFKNINLNEILSCVFLFASKTLKRSIRKSKLIIEDDFIEIIINIYSKYLVGTNNDIRVTLKMLSEYKHNIIALKLNNELDDEKEKDKYKDIALKQIKAINDFFDSLHLKDKMYEELKEFDRLIETNSPLNGENYKKLNDIFKYAVYPVPQMYVDYFLKSLLDKIYFYLKMYYIL